ncbi:MULTISPECIES: acyl-CoA dehydrogenase family protein [Pseudomonas fluorescens group]
MSNALIQSLNQAIGGPLPEAVRRNVAELLADDIFRQRLDLAGRALHRNTYAQLRTLIQRLPSSPKLFDSPQYLLALSEQIGIRNPSLFIAFAIHYGLCISTLAAFESGNKMAGKLRRAMESGKTVGAYMITELGRSNGQITTRTEAVYDPATHAFVLHSPDNGAVKFSNVGVSDQSKLGIVCARLRVAGQDCGVFAFAMPISTRRGPKPGVRMSEAAEIPLVPFDYGLCAFDHMRLPFDAWLNDGAGLDKNGVFHDPLGDPDKRLIRTLVAPKHVWAMGSRALAAVTCTSAALALKHATQRFTMARMAPQTRLLDYSTQQRALFVALATGYAMTCFSNDACADWAEHLKQKHVAATDISALNFAPWSAAHRRLALTKVLTAWAAEETCAECRLRCGVAGDLSLNGFLHWQGLGHVFNDAGGNNWLILFDTARSLLAEPLPDAPAPCMFDTSSLPSLLGLVKTRAYRLRQALAVKFQSSEAQGCSAMELWNPLLPLAREVALAHGLVLIVESAIKTNEAVADPQARQLLEVLTQLYVLEHIQRQAAWYLSEALFDAHRYHALETAITVLCERLTGSVEPLISAFGSRETAVPRPLEDPTQCYPDALMSALTRQDHRSR